MNDAVVDCNQSGLYFYCHATGGEAAEPPADPPFLQLEPDNDGKGRIDPADIA